MKGQQLKAATRFIEDDVLKLPPLNVHTNEGSLLWGIVSFIGLMVKSARNCFMAVEGLPRILSK